jgi:hypothetical protein
VAKDLVMYVCKIGWSTSSKINKLKAVYIQYMYIVSYTVKWVMANYGVGNAGRSHNRWVAETSPFTCYGLVSGITVSRAEFDDFRQCPAQSTYECNEAYYVYSSAGLSVHELKFVTKYMQIYTLGYGDER